MTAGRVVAGRFERSEALGYIVAQLVGAMRAWAVWRWLAPEDAAGRG